MHNCQIYRAVFKLPNIAQYCIVLYCIVKALPPRGVTDIGEGEHMLPIFPTLGANMTVQAVKQPGQTRGVQASQSLYPPI